MASRSAQTVKQSSVPAAELAAKPPCQIHSLAVVADKAQITGTHSVIIGENSILHPYAKIRSDHGRVVIGRDTVICEKAVVGAAGPSGEGEECHVVLGNGVNVENGAIVEASIVGDGTLIEVRAMVGRGATIGKHCKVTSMNVIQPNENLPDFTVVYGDGQRRTNTARAANDDIQEAKQKEQAMHLELLKRLIPNAASKWG